MEELIKKLEQLKELIKAVKLQTPAQQNGPKLPQLPTPKQPPTPSMTPSAAKAPKIGTGAGPDSKKDPKKMAEQIKNGSMSTKTQKIMLKVADNGQWSLEKNWTAKDRSNARNWMHNGTREWLKFPPLKGKDRVKALNNISKETESRINPDTGEKEFKLFRSAPKGDKFHENNLTSWSTAPSMAHYWAGLQVDEEDNINNNVMHAWVPEKHIHSHLPTMVGTEHEKGGENEVMVQPHDFNIFHIEDPKDPTKV
jgi:hypothetical protein